MKRPCYYVLEGKNPVPAEDLLEWGHEWACAMVRASIAQKERAE